MTSLSVPLHAVQAKVHTAASAWEYPHTYIHACTQTYIHTYIHTYIRTVYRLVVGMVYICTDAGGWKVYRSKYGGKEV